uniref:Non-haem dioxygenase N-terminal domain-containing protein n=1 Tax=Branchiostoma floridae TaxID=7739 RepID=C3Y7D2_BRAFL|eukprot:XP_002607750.1 hypothetical protein BRAFLDRAFT_82802 [Branchiostoma floridae]
MNYRMDQGTHEHGPIHWEAAPGTDGHIPILDFSSYSLLKGAVDEDELQPLATQLIQAFSTVGFVYLRNHGIPSALLWPSQEMPEFQQVTLQMFDKSRQLSLRIIELMGRGLNIQDMPSLLSMHSMMGTGPNGSVMRTLRYPPVSAHVKAGQIRCGEHTDYGSITLVFQDNVSGLESHRVVIPETEEGRKTSRRSLAFFAHPDDDAVITCLDGSNKYPPITAGEYLKQKLTATYDVN